MQIKPAPRHPAPVELMNWRFHKDYESTRVKLASFGLRTDRGGLQETERATLSGDDRMTPK